MSSTSAIDVATKRVLCVGTCCLDFVQICEATPADNERNVSKTGYWQRGGNASNICTVLRKLDMKCEFFGMLTKVPGFAFLLDDCRKRGISIENCPLGDEDPPMSSVILVLANHTRTRIHSNKNCPSYTYEDFLSIADLSAFGWIHLEGRLPEETVKIMSHLHKWNLAKSDKITVSLQLKRKDKEILLLAPWADYVFVSKEFATFMGWMNMRDALFGLRQLIKPPLEQKTNFTQPTLICSWSQNGAGCLTPTNDYSEIAPQLYEVVVDTLGAGDTFCASVIYALYQNECSLKDAVAFGNCVAGFKVGFCGYEEINQFKKHGFK